MWGAVGVSRSFTVPHWDGPIYFAQIWGGVIVPFVRAAPRSA